MLLHNLKNKSGEWKIKVRKWKDNFKWTKRKVGFITLTAFLIVFLTISVLPESYFLGAPPIQYFSEYTNVETQIAPLPSFTFDQHVILTAIGSFSVNNPIHVKIIINNVNVTNLLAYYDAVILYDGYPLTYKLNSTQITPDQEQIKLAPYPNNPNVYIAEGDVRFLTAGTTYLLFVPNPAQNIHWTGVVIYSTMEKNAPPVITITGVSDTLSTHFSESTAKIAWEVGAFGIIILQPVLEAILVREEKPITIPPQKPP